MSNGFNRRKFSVKGLGNFQFLSIEPTLGSDFASVGFTQETTLNDDPSMQDLVAETGVLLDTLVQSKKVSGSTSLMQSSIDEFNLIRNAVGMVHALRYYGIALQNGAWQFFCIPRARIVPKLEAGYKPGPRLLPMGFAALNQADLAFTVPEYYMLQRDAAIMTSGLMLWAAPREGLSSGTVKLLDASGWERHGTLSSNTLWQLASGVQFLRFNGTADKVDLGNVLNDDASGDFALDIWVRLQGADGSTQEILAKKADLTTNGAGWGLYRSSANKIVFKISDGSASASATSTASVLSNTWTHVAVSVDRNGNAQLYINGAPSGSAVSVATINTATNALSLLMAADGTNYGQVDLDDLRVNRWVGGSLPSDVATQLQTNYTACRAYYGV